MKFARSKDLELKRCCEELCDSKEKCYEISLECAKKLKDNFGRVGAFSCEQKFIRGDPDGLSSGSLGRLKLLTRYSAIEGISALLLVPAGLYQFWKRSAVTMRRLLFS
jgi:hypothetical protein